MKISMNDYCLKVNFYHHWDQLAQSGSRFKDAAPIIGSLEKVKAICSRIDNALRWKCFACAATVFCKKCPVRWRAYSAGGYRHCNVSGSEFYEWVNSDSTVERKYWADKIRRLPWHGEPRDFTDIPIFTPKERRR